MNNEYDVDYFINFFTAIPEDRWFTGGADGPNGTHCAIGHIKAAHRGTLDASMFFGEWYESPPQNEMHREMIALRRLLGRAIGIINDGLGDYQQPTPKQRILAALHDIKRQQEQAQESALDRYELRPLNLTKPEPKEAHAPIA